MFRQVYVASYSPVGDLTVISVCLVMLILMVFSYIRRTRSFRIFLSVVGLLMGAAFSDILFHVLAASGHPGRYAAASAMRCVYHALLFAIFFLFVVYIAEVTRLERNRRKPYVLVSAAVLLGVVCVDVADTFRDGGMRVTEYGLAFNGRGVFFAGYLAFVAIILVLMVGIRKRLYKRVMMGFYGTMGISFAMLMLQGLKGQSSFTVATFMYPVIAMFYIMHSNPYDVRLGAIDSRALEDTVRYSYEKKQVFWFMSLYMRAFDEEGKQLPEALQATIRRFAGDFFRGALLFQVGGGHVMLLFSERRNPDYEKRIRRIMEAFYEEHERFNYEYKIVVGRSIDEVSRKNEYVSFIRGVHRDMPENSVHRIENRDVVAFNRNEYILRQLENIHNRRDMEDPRVLAYCQPVYNLSRRCYDTAEALMRLRLDGNLVSPAQFIPLAEENGYIHTLTEIMMNKTCREVRRLLEQGYEVSRVSVNVSALELKAPDFCDDITRIIGASGLSGERIAIELTESQTDSDFELMKDKISQLRGLGIKFYLDDFGTGYSNMERIMELPFDIIKFDRSMVQGSAASDRSRQIVAGLANLFSQQHFSVLYEGIEEASDEAMCEAMCASYLQGYRYSRPVPIEELERFFTRKEAAD